MTQPTFCHRDAFWVLGIQERANPMEVDYRAFWDRFGQRAGEIQPLAIEPAGYGVYFPTDQEGVVDVFGGMAVAPGAAAPEGLVSREVPEADYAVFECSMSEIGPTWGAIYGGWLPSSGYVADGPKPCFEHFPPGCHEGTAPVRIHLPVRKRTP